MTLKLNGTNSVAAPAYAGDDADTGLQCGTDELKLVTGGTARATVDSSGDLGIGTTSPSTLIHGEASTAELRLKSTGASNSALVSFIPGTQTNPFYVYVTPTRNLVFQDNSTERMRILSDGTIRLASGCPGIDFSQIQTNASGMTSETLDSYEEGTWTPTLSWGGTSATLSGDTYGYYTKIGNSVMVQFRIVQTARNTPSGSASMGGLPFSEGAAVYNHGMVQGDNGISMPAGAGSIMMYISGTTSRFLYQGNTGHADFLSSHCADATRFYGFAIYNT